MLAHDGVAVDGSSTSKFINNGTVRKTGGADATAIAIAVRQRGHGRRRQRQRHRARRAAARPTTPGTWAGNVALTGGAFTLGARTWRAGG